MNNQSEKKCSKCDEKNLDNFYKYKRAKDKVYLSTYCKQLLVNIIQVLWFF